MGKPEARALGMAVIILAFAGRSAASVAGAAVLQIPVSARAVGMGGIEASLYDPLGASWVNPGNVLGAKGLSIYMAPRIRKINQLVPDVADGIYFTHEGLSVMILDTGPWSVHASAFRSYIHYSRTPWDTGPPSHESAEAMGLALSYADRLGVGMRWKRGEVDFSFGHPPRHFATQDLGLFAHAIDSRGLGDVFTAISLSNFTSPTDDRGWTLSDPLPKTLRLGTSWMLPWQPQVLRCQWATTFALEREELRVRGGHTTWHYGLEVACPYLALRGGRWSDPDGDIVDWTWGLGFTLPAASGGLRLDLANQPQATELDRVWKGSISILLPYGA